MNRLSVAEGILNNEDFWWLIGYLQGDGTVDRKNGIWFISKDHELINNAKEAVCRLFGLPSKVYVEQSKPPAQPKLRLAVYSRQLYRWLHESGLKFGKIEWNVPIIPRGLFSPYLSGLFDAEGHIQLRRNKFSGKKIDQVIIYSINRQSLEQISVILNEQGVKSSLLERKRLNKPNLHYELRIYGSSNLKWFTENVGKYSHLSRKKELLNKQFLPRATLIAPGPKA